MKRFAVAMGGGVLLIVGLVMLVLPGPGLPILIAALAVLATEFFWARRALRSAKGNLAKVRRKTGLAAWLRKVRRARQSTGTLP
jgi:hypothetical protein